MCMSSCPVRFSLAQYLKCEWLYLYGIISASSKRTDSILESNQTRSQQGQRSEMIFFNTSFLFKVYFNGINEP